MATFRRFARALTCCGVLVGALVAARPLHPAPRQPSDRVARSARLPLSFTANGGEADPRVDFSARGDGYAVSLAAGDALLAAGSRDVRLTLLDRQAHPKGRGVSPLPGKVNYLIGNDPSRWRTNVPTYAKVRYERVYPGVDVVYYGRDGQIEYDFEVAPHADPRAIRMAVAGAGPLSIDPAGDLVGTHGFRLRRPIAYQHGMGGATRLVDVRYTLHGSDEARLVLGAYDAAQPLVIDPVLLYSTFLGGSRTDHLNGPYGGSRALAIDRAGNAYVAGQTNSFDFPSTDGSTLHSWVNPDNPLDIRYGHWDAFVAKLSADGSSLIYATYIGGGFDDWANAIDVDAAGNAYITGNAGSDDFPNRRLSDGHAFVMKLDASGSVILYTALFDTDEPQAIAVDAAGSAYITGATRNQNSFAPELLARAAQPLCSCYPWYGETDSSAFVAKLNPGGTAFAYATYLGGSRGDVGTDIAVDSEGNALVIGVTTSTDFPTVHAAQSTIGGTDWMAPHDAFVTKVNATGTAFVYSTYLGGSGDENRVSAYGLGRPASGIAVDPAGNAYVTGFTLSPDFPTTEGAYQRTRRSYQDAFVVRYDPAGTVVYSTLLGGNNDDTGYGIAVDHDGNAHVTGVTASTDFPTTADAIQRTSGADNGDVFVTKLGADGASVLFSTYLGGLGGEVGHGIALGSDGSIYVAGDVTDFAHAFPVTAGAFQTAPPSPNDRDVFVVRIGEAHVNHAPVARAGSDQVIEATSSAGAAVLLDGSASTDADGDTLACTWREGTAILATTATPAVTLGLGSHSLTLSVDDGHGGTSSDDVLVTVRDTTRPTITALAPSRTILWPVTNRMVPITLTVTATDLVTPNPECSVDGVTSNEPGPGQHLITSPLSVNLLASRNGSGTGRIYTISITCADEAGNRASATTNVTVPHDQRK